MHCQIRMLLRHIMKRLRKLSTHSRKSFQSSPFWEDLISARSSFYTLTRTLLVLVLLLANLMRKARNMLSPMHLETTTRLKATTFHTKGSVLLLYGLSYISGLIFMAPSSLCIPTTSLSSGWWPMTMLTGKLVRWAFILQEYEFKVIHRPNITHQNTDTMSRRPFTTSEIFSKTKQDFDQIPVVHVFYASSYLALLQCNLVEHPIVDIWEDLDILRFLQHGEYLPQITSNHWDRIQQQSKDYSWKDNHLVQCLPQGDRVVPPLHERHGLIQKVHSKLKHFWN
jgi:hypothetical protein